MRNLLRLSFMAVTLLNPIAASATPVDAMVFSKITVTNPTAATATDYVIKIEDPNGLPALQSLRSLDFPAVAQNATPTSLELTFSGASIEPQHSATMFIEFKKTTNVLLFTKSELSFPGAVSTLGT